MRPSLTAAGVIGAALVPGIASAAAPSPSTAAPPRTHLSRVTCHHALDPAARYVSLTAVMRPLPATQRLAVRFRLLERAAGASSYTSVPAAGLGRWLFPKDPSTLGQRPGDVWKVVKPIADLAAPATYRFAVDFRWLAADGHALGTVTRLSRRCFQPELRPDLVVRSIEVSADPSRSGFDDYLVEVDNTGATAAGSFTVEFSGGGAVRDQTVDRLDAHSSRRLRFVGPVCRPGAPPTVTADPQHQVDVYTRAQATMVAACPGSG
jgi:hypothetical protein